MTNDTITQDLVSLEKKYWTAMAEHDLKTAVELTDFPCIVASAHGPRLVDRAQFEKLFNSHREAIKSFSFEGKPEVRLLSEETAIIAYQIRATVSFEGKELAMNAIDTSTWIKRNGKWACAMHTEVEAAKKH